MNPYLAILKALLNHDTYTKYVGLINYEFIKDNYPETFKLFCVVEHLHSHGQGDYSLADVEIGLLTLYPQTKPNEFAPLFEQLASITVDPATVSAYLNQLQYRAGASKVAEAALRFAEGNVSLDELQETIAGFQSTVSVPKDSLNEFISDDLDELKETQYLSPGLRWRLDSLNRNLGSLRKGDFGFVFARPETGKTTFLASEVSHMASQASGPILWFHGEESGSKVLTRCIQGCLGLTLPALFSDVAANKQRYSASTGNRLKLPPSEFFNRRDIESFCARHNPALIIIDPLDDLPGFNYTRGEDRKGLELTRIYRWARELAQKYAPVIAVCQAGASGEGKRQLTMNDVDESKVGKQKTADWILGIGKANDSGLNSIRYFHLSKNKLLGDSDSDQLLRHGFWEVQIRPDIARYADF